MKIQESARILIPFLIAASVTWLELAVGQGATARLDPLSIVPAGVGEEISLRGEGFGAAPGTVILTGRQIKPRLWSDQNIVLAIPDDGASGFIYVQPAMGPPSDLLPFTVNRRLPSGQLAPCGLKIADTGLPGAAFLVETDGSYLYGISGFETLSTYQHQNILPHVLRSRTNLNQRVADLRLAGGFLFCVGDHGLVIYRCADLQAGAPMAVAAVAGGSYLGVDARPDPVGEFDGLLLALAEHMPVVGSSTLRVVCYQFAGEKLTRLGTFTRTVGAEERQFAVALDPRIRKAYVSGWGSLTGTNKYLLELSTTNLARPVLQHREETGSILAGDMDVSGDLLWIGSTTTALGNELFRVYTLNAGTEPLRLSRVITGGLALGRVARVKVLDSQVTTGCSWYGNRPDIYLLTTRGTHTTAVATMNSLDWAFDVTGFARVSGTNAGKILVADEWGGFITLNYQTTPRFRLAHQPDYQWIISAAMIENLHLAGERVYVAGRGAGPWSADRFNLADASQWRHVDFDWSQAEPQPHPVSALCTWNSPEAGLLIAALGHEKAMAWGEEIIGLLYRETATNIQLLAQADPVNPPGAGSTGVSAIWPEPDLVFLVTGSDGFRAYVVNPDIPSITLHHDCRTSGFATNIFSTAMAARCLKHYTDGRNRKLIIGSTPGLLVSNPTLNLFALSYPDGVPDRNHPDRSISVVHETALQCLKWKPVYNLDIRPSGLVAVATSAGLAMFHLSWVPELNQMNDFAAWNRIRIPPEAYAPWWSTNWTADFADVSFAAEDTLYAVKATEGLWRLAFELDPTNHTHQCMATAYYPGVSCGMNYTQMLHGWIAPDVPTLHHPYAVVADGDMAYVTGWSGKVQRLMLTPDAGVRLQNIHISTDQVAFEFLSPFPNRTHLLEVADRFTQPNWLPCPNASLHTAADGVYQAIAARSHAPTEFYRIRVRP